MKKQSGNALFLILIAVALFAALSYAITQSGRGGGSISREKTTIAASQVTQYASGIRTSLQRMVMLGGIAVESICYNESHFWDRACAAPEQYQLFAPNGGGAVGQCPTVDQVTGEASRHIWSFEGIHKNGNEGVYIKDLGSNADVAGRDVVAHLWDVRLSVCQQINKGLGLTETPADNANYTGRRTTTYDLNQNVIYALPGEAFGCVDNGDGLADSGPGNEIYMYYHSLYEQ